MMARRIGHVLRPASLVAVWLALSAGCGKPYRVYAGSQAELPPRSTAAKMLRRLSAEGKRAVPAKPRHGEGAPLGSLR